MRRRIEALWYRDKPPPLWLRALAWLFGRVASWRRRWQVPRAEATALPVIVVGNISVGGTGKSPVVSWLIGELQALGFQPGIVARGYGSRGPAHPRRLPDDATPEEYGDEPVMLARRTGVPVAVGADRSATVACLAETGGLDIAVSDDGLQHYRMARAFEIAVIDGIRGLGNGALLPAGPLREPPARLLDVDLVLVNGGNWQLAGVPAVRFHLLLGDAHRLDGSRQQALAEFRGQPVHAVAGIGHPERFFSRLEAAGLELLRHPFPDHHAFAAADLAFDDDFPVLMTEKDAVKCRGFASDRLWSVPAEVAFGDDEAGDVRKLLRAALAPEAGAPSATPR